MIFFLVQDTQFPVKVTQYSRHKWLNGSHLKAVCTQALHKKLVRIRMIPASEVPTYESNAHAHRMRPCITTVNKNNLFVKFQLVL